MKKLTTFFCLLLSLNSMGQSLPMTVTQTEFNNGNIFYSKPSVSWDGGKGIKSSLSGGECYFKFTDTPEKISLQHSKSGLSTGSIYVYGSPDGTNWTELLANGSSSSWNSWSTTLDRNTRYIKLKRTGTMHGWWKNIVVTKRPLIASTFTLPQLQAAVNSESEKQSFTITKTALTNDVTVTCDNPLFTVTPSTLDKSNGTINIEVTFNPTSKGEQTGTITVQEDGTSNKEIVAISGLGTTAELSATPLINFSTVEGKPVTQETTVTTKDLEGNVTLAITGEGAAHFSLSRTEMTENGIIVVTYQPLASGTHSATLTLSTPFAGDVVLPLTGSATRSPFNSIFDPLIIGESQLNNSAIVVEKSSISWGSGTVDSGDGKGFFVVKVENTPNSLTFDCSRNKWGTNRVMKVEESSDNATWTTLATSDPSTNWENHQYPLKQTTRYLRFSYSSVYIGGDFGTRNCYWRNIKVIKNNIQSTTLALESFTNSMGTSETKSFEIGAANLTGALQIVSSSNLFTISPAEVAKADAERIYGFPIEVTFSPVETGKFEGVIDITDVENSSNILSIQVLGITKPTTPTSLPADQILPNAFRANWESVEGVRSYLLTVNKEGEATPILNKVDIGNVTEYILGDLSAGTKYNYQVWSVGAGELTSDEGSTIIDVTTLVRPTITTSTPAEFQTTEKVSKRQEITINAKNLLNKISITVVGTNAALFSLNTYELADGGIIEVTYNPTVSGTHTAVLQIETLYAENIFNLPLSGISKPTAPEALTATEITPIGFTAKWKAQTGITGYKLWVKDQMGQSIGEYNGKELGVVTSFNVKGLNPSAKYIYELTALNGDLTSDSSNSIEVTTGEAPSITHSPVSEFQTIINKKKSQSINISGERLTRYIEVTVSGDYFSADKNEILPTGESLRINFLPLVDGEFNGEIRLNTPFAQEVIISLTGKATTATSIVNVCTNNNCAQYITIENQQLYYTFDNETTIRLTNSQGSIVKIIQGTIGVASLENLPKGVYLIQFTVNGKPFILKIML